MQQLHKITVKSESLIINKTSHLFN